MKFIFALLGLVLLAFSAVAQEPVFAVQVKEEHVSTKELELIRKTGFTAVRFPLPWALVEKSEGTYRWAHFKPFVEKARAQGLKSIIILIGGNPLYTENAAPPSSKEEREAFARFAAQAARELGGPDVIWEIWNEPDLARFWIPKPDAHAYAALAEESCRVIRRVDPEALILAPAMADMPGRFNDAPDGFLDVFLKSDAARCASAFSFHPYRDFERPPETVLSAYDKLRKYIDKHAPRKTIRKLAATEWGFSLVHVSKEEQADYAVRSFLVNTLAGVNFSVWYEWRDSGFGKNDPEAHFGLLDVRGREKPALKALKELLPVLGEMRFERRVELGKEGVFALLFASKDGARRLVFWDMHGARGMRLVLRASSGARGYSLTGRPEMADLGAGPFSATVFMSEEAL